MFLWIGNSKLNRKVYVENVEKIKQINKKFVSSKFADELRYDSEVNNILLLSPPPQRVNRLLVS